MNAAVIVAASPRPIGDEDTGGNQNQNADFAEKTTSIG
jgi:hypothetical protein